MKKISLIGLSLFTAFAVVAQTTVVKDVERELKATKPNFSKALADIKPALTNPETAETMMPWYLAGKAAFGVFEDAYVQESLGQALTPENKNAAGLAYVEGYNNYIKALHLDSVPDAKGKIKPKKSKEIQKELANGFNNIYTAAVFLMQASNYDGAYDAWELYVTMPGNPVLGKSQIPVLPDTILGQAYFYQATCMLASDQMKQDDAKVVKALKKLNQVMGTGFRQPEVYTYGILASNRLGDKAEKTKFAQAGYDMYGTADITFIGELINNKLEVEDYPGALEFADKAIAATDPSNAELLAQIYSIKGIVASRSENFDGAIEVLKQSLSYNPNLADANFYLAQAMLQKVEATVNADEKLSMTDFKLELLEAAEYLKKAYELDDVKYSTVPDNLYRIYYNLGADYVEESKYWEMLR